MGNTFGLTKKQANDILYSGIGLFGLWIFPITLYLIWNIEMFIIDSFYNNFIKILCNCYYVNYDEAWADNSIISTHILFIIGFLIMIIIGSISSMAHYEREKEDQFINL